MKTKLAIFDLGNVLFEADFEKAIHFWSRMSGVSARVIRERFNMGNDFEEFERGEISQGAFFSSLSNQLQLSLSDETLMNGWNSIYGEVMLSSYKAIQTFADIIPSVALTNTNITHYLVWKERYNQELQVFHKIYVSSELGMRKPEQRIFEHVLYEWNTEPTGAIFFDDIADNLKGAAALGIDTVLVKSDLTIPAWVNDHICSQQDAVAPENADKRRY